LKAELLFGVVVRAFGLYGMLWGLYECFTGFYVAVAHTSYHQGAVFNFLAFGLFLLIVSYSLIRSFALLRAWFVFVIEVPMTRTFDAILVGTSIKAASTRRI